MPNTEAFVTQLFIRLASGFFGIALIMLWRTTRGLVAGINTLGDAIAGFFCAPFVGLCERIKSALSSRLPAKKTNSSRPPSKLCPALGSPRALCSLLFSLILITVCFLRVQQQGNMEPYLMKLFFSTPLGYIFDLIFNKISLHPATLVSTACSTLIAWLLFTGGNGENCSADRLWEKAIVFLYHIVYLVAGCIIAVWLADYWQMLADWFSALYANLRQAFDLAKASGAGIAELIFAGVPLALLLYIWVTAMAMAVREYASTIGHAVLAGLLMAGIWLILNALLPDAWKHGPAGDPTGYALIALTIFISECTRSDPDFMDLGRYST